MSHDLPSRTVVAIGLGGIYEGYGLHLPLLHRTGQVPLHMLVLVDGDVFEEQNRGRQSFDAVGPKAVARRDQLLSLSSEVPVRALSVYVTPENVHEVIPDGATVLLSPDNHPTRKLVSDHVKTLDECLLIVGANDGIDAVAGTDGTEGWVMVYWRKEGTDLTAPIDVFHPEIGAGSERGPWEAGCGELIQQGARQILQTNLLVGQWMVHMLIRYAQLPSEEAVSIGEVAVNSRTGSVVPKPRRPGVRRRGEYDEDAPESKHAPRGGVPQDS